MGRSSYDLGLVGRGASVVTLIGRVRTSAVKQDAERIARGINGAKGLADGGKAERIARGIN